MQSFIKYEIWNFQGCLAKILRNTAVIESCTELDNLFVRKISPLSIKNLNLTHICTWFQEWSVYFNTFLCRSW